jgi:hypothetical protein
MERSGKLETLPKWLKTGQDATFLMKLRKYPELATLHGFEP